MIQSADISFKSFLREHENTYDDLQMRSLGKYTHPEVQDRMQAATAFLKDPKSLFADPKRENSKNKIFLGNKRIVVSKYRQPPIAMSIVNQDIKQDHHHGRKVGGGLWYGIGSKWLDFAYSDAPIMIHMFIHEIIIDTKKIAIINSEDSKRNFERRYGFKFFYTDDGKKNFIKLSDQQSSLNPSLPPETLINWPDVKKDYSGIEISGDGLTNQEWQEMWDLPSGVIWDQSAIRNTRLLYVYNVKTREYVRPETLGIYAGKSRLAKNPLPPANVE